jgi:hypothetical protein
VLLKGEISMTARKFKFVSPGVFLKEIDNSQIPKGPGAIGPVIIGRTKKGPALKPFKVQSYSDFVEIFGSPIAGGQGQDIYREGNGLLASAPAHYAAKAYFSADISSPVTVVRLLGVEGDDAGASGEAGWQTNSAYGLFAAVSSSTAVGAQAVTASLIGIVYNTEADASNLELGLKGVDVSNNSTTELFTTGAQSGSFILPDSNNRYTFYVKDHQDASNTREIKISFENDKDFIRSVLNTNPLYSNTNITTTTPVNSDKYWLGETFERTFQEVKTAAGNGKVALALARLNDSTDTDMSDFTQEMAAARTGWVFHQNTESTGSYDPANFQKLFRLIALHEGEESSRDTVVSIEDIRVPAENAADPYGSFSVVVSRLLAGRLEVVESFSNCNLNPNSQNYIARVIGDQYFDWSRQEKRNKLYGSYSNQSKYIRVDMNPDVDASGPTNPSHVPFGFFGPVVPKMHRQARDGSGQIELGAASTTFLDQQAVLQWSGSTNQELCVKWSTLPQVVSASLRGTDHFGAAVYKVDAGGDLSDQIDYGYVDYVRALPQTFSSDVSTGETDSNSEYAFTFSLDEVYISGSDLSDPETARIKKVHLFSGSHVGVGSIPGVTAVTAQAASASLNIPAAGATLTGSFTLTDAQGDDVTFEFFPAQGAESVTGGNIKFQNSAAVGTVEGLVVTAINNYGPLGFGTLQITASALASEVRIKSTVSGSAGSTQIVTSSTNSTDLVFEDGSSAAFVGKDIQLTGGVDAVAAVPATPEFSSYTAQYSASLLTELGFNKFRMPLVGGFDGVDITEADPFNNRVLLGKTTATSYAYASVDRAIELIRDPEAVEHNLAVMPGITNDSLTTKLVRTCENRADSLAIIDLKDIYVPPSEQKCSSFSDRLKTTPQKAAKALTSRQLNSSYGATYYPWVKIKDDENDADVWVPPSVIALGVMAYTEQRDEVWFAPAGFNRGGLNEGNAGLPVLQASEQLLSKQRDTLYEANINPIASFVSEGIVVFGQKTLQSSQSALDRINVRRLLIFVKKEVSRISNALLFDQNLQATWNRFLGQVVPLLESVKARLGLADFRVILDETTTTPDLIDRNIMYAKIFLKPARSIEFIAVDFVITNTGASFED